MSWCTYPRAWFKQSLHSSWKFWERNLRLHCNTCRFSEKQHRKSPLFPSALTHFSIQVVKSEISISQQAMIESCNLPSKGKLSPMHYINFISGHMFLFYLSRLFHLHAYVLLPQTTLGVTDMKTFHSLHYNIHGAPFWLICNVKLTHTLTFTCPFNKWV